MTSSVESQGRKALNPQQEAWTDAVMKLLSLAKQKQSETASTRRVELWNTTSLHNRYSETYERAVIEDRTKTEERLDNNKEALELLRLEIIEKAKTATPEELEQLEERRDELVEQIEEDKTALELMDKTKMRLDTIEHVESDLSGQLSALGSEITELEEALDEAFDSREEALSKLDPKEKERFTFEHDAIALQIENSFARVFPMKKLIPGPNNTVIEEVRSYTEIDDTEYAILYGMLAKAELIFLGADTGLTEAMVQLEKTRRQLTEFQAARRGYDVLPPKTSISTPLDSYLIEIESKAAMLRNKGYTHAADELKLQHDMLNTQVQRQAGSDLSQVAPKFTNQMVNLRDAAQREYDLMLEVEAELAKVELTVRTFKANEQAGYARRAQAKLDNFDRDRPLSECLEDAKALVERYERHARHGIDRGLETASTEDTDLSREALEERLQQIRETYDSLFKHNKDGTVKMIIDTQTRDEKGAKKFTYRDVPREAIREFELMMQAAEQLLESGSIDALKKADMWLAGTQTAMDNVKRNPDLYSRLQDLYKARETRLKKVEKKYPQFALGDRAELRQELAECEKDLKTVFQAELENRLRDLDGDISTHKSTCSALKGQHKTLTTQAEEIGKLLNRLGDSLKAWKKKGLSTVDFDGYWGTLRTELKTAQGKIDRRQKATMNEAKDELVKIRTQAEKVLELFRKMDAKEELTFPEQSEMMKFLREAKAGQETHTQSEAVHEEYTQFKKQLETDIGNLIKKLKALKMDPSDAEVLEQRRSSVRSEIKGSKDYPHGLAEMRKIREEYAKLKRQVDQSQEIVDKTLVEVALAIQSKMGEFREELEGFLEDAVEPEGGEEYEGVDTGKVSGFLTMLDTAVPASKVTDIVSKSRIVADGDQSLDDRKLARRVALGALRGLMQVFDGFPAMAHYRGNPFGGSDTADTLKRVLPRLEMKLLTALPKS